MSFTSKVSSSGKRVADGLFRRFKRVRRTFVRLDQEAVLNVLKTFGTVNADLLFVHSSLSACGFINGGPATVVSAIRSWITDRPLLAMPTHTWSYPDEFSKAPVYDYTSTPSLVGTITNYFWRQSGVIRSLHPSHSLACYGPDSEVLCRSHELCDTPCGRGTPYERIAEGNSSVLMFGATLDSYTLFHTAEDAAKVTYLYMPKQVTLRTRLNDGTVKSLEMWRQDMKVTRRFAAMDSWLEDERLLFRRKLGLGELLFIPSAAEVHARIVKELQRDPLFLVAESIRPRLRKNGL